MLPLARVSTGLTGDELRQPLHTLSGSAAKWRGALHRLRAPGGAGDRSRGGGLHGVWHPSGAGRSLLRPVQRGAGGVSCGRGGSAGMRLRGLIGFAILLLIVVNSARPVLAGGVSGTVVDGSNANRPVGGIAMTLQTREATPRTVDRARSDSKGRYRFGTGATGARNDALVATYQGITYTQPISAGTTLQVFQTTSNDSQLVSQTTLVFVDLAAGAWQVLVWHKFSNLDTRAYDGSLHFTLPEGGRDLAPLHGASGVQQWGRTITYKAAILPGLDSGANYIYEYRFPYTGDDLPFTLVTDYPTQTLAFPPPGW